MTVYGEGEHGEVIAVEPKCAECGHDYGICIETPDGCSWNHPTTGSDCDCPGYRPPTTEPSENPVEPAEREGKVRYDLELLKRPDGSLELVEDNPPPALEDAKAFLYQLVDGGCIDGWIEQGWPERLEQYADKRLEAERERIVDEFIEGVLQECRGGAWQRIALREAMQAVKARGGVK